MESARPTKSELVRDPVIQYLIHEAAACPWILRLILFGSRARGDQHERSDYDVAAVVTQNDLWPGWVLNVKENAPTLCGLDVVKLDEKTSPHLREVISREGQVFYEQAK